MKKSQVVGPTDSRQQLLEDVLEEFSGLCFVTIVPETGIGDPSSGASFD